MHEIFITVTGNVASRPRLAVTKAGHAVTSFRLASTPRRYDKAKAEWSDGPTAWFSVSCWRALADHVGSSLSLGDPVIVHGKLQVRDFTRGDGTAGTSLDLDAQTIGHDLNRGTSMYSRTPRPGEGRSEPSAEPGAEPSRDPQQAPPQAA